MKKGRCRPGLSKELHLRKLSGLLVDEQVTIEALSRRIDEDTALTTAGRAFLERVRIVLDDTAGAVYAAQRASRGETGRIRVGFMTGHKDKSLAQHRLHAFNSDIEFVAWESWHDHVAQNQVKVCGNNSAQPFDTVVHRWGATNEPDLTISDSGRAARLWQKIRSRSRTGYEIPPRWPESQLADAVWWRKSCRFPRWRMLMNGFMPMLCRNDRPFF